MTGCQLWGGTFWGPVGTTFEALNRTFVGLDAELIPLIVVVESPLSLSIEKTPVKPEGGQM